MTNCKVIINVKEVIDVAIDDRVAVKIHKLIVFDEIKHRKLCKDAGFVNL